MWKVILILNQFDDKICCVDTVNKDDDGYRVQGSKDCQQDVFGISVIFQLYIRSLTAYKLCENAVLGNKLFVVALFGNTAVIKDDYSVAMSDGR